MKTAMAIGAALLLVLGSAAGSAAHEKQTEHTLKLAPGEKPGAATIADMAWMAGHWVGEGLGGRVEEMWTPPEGGVMLGSFRLVRDGRAVFYELLTITEEEGSLVLRLKHFNPDLTGWEEKDRSVEFRFVAKAGGALHFAGLTLVPEGDALTMYLAIARDGTVREETFRYQRVRTGMPR